LDFEVRLEVVVMGGDGGWMVVVDGDVMTYGHEYPRPYLSLYLSISVIEFPCPYQDATYCLERWQQEERGRESRNFVPYLTPLSLSLSLSPFDAQQHTQTGVHILALLFWNLPCFSSSNT